MSDSDKNPQTVHEPVMLREVLQQLELSPGLSVVDGTVGGGGHARRILPRIQPGGTLIGLDRDLMMLEFAAQTLDTETLDATNSGDACILKQSSYLHLPEVLESLEEEFQGTQVDRILLDLGLSSDQLAHEERGFGFQTPGKLDLRFNIDEGQPAWKLLERSTEEELFEIFQSYGEEPFSAQLARAIVAVQTDAPIRTAPELLALIQNTIPKQLQRTARTHPATRVFQALRIAVNQELEHLRSALIDTLPTCLKPGGRLLVISFHSLEDRLVKSALRDPLTWQNLTPKPIVPTSSEQRLNPRSRSAKLRVAIKK